MGLTGDEVNRGDTQKIDSQFAAGHVADDIVYHADTMPLVDDFLLQDAFKTQIVSASGETKVMDFGDEIQVMDFGDETQVVNFGGETQVMDFGGETQVMDFGGETQVLNDLDCLKKLPADVFDEYNAEAVTISYSEASNKTEVLYDSDEVSQGDSMNIDRGDSVGQQNTVDSYPPKKADIVSGAPSETVITEQHHSGYRRFTSIRAAAVRASGLAARARAAKSNSFSTRSDKSSLEQLTFDQVDSFLVGDVSRSCMKTIGDHNGGEQRNLNSCEAGSKAARKLFMEEKVGQLEADMNHTDDNLNMPETENCLAGLSYANSQQPGELSQANAIEVVDRFLEQNIMKFDLGLHSRIPVGEKLKVVSGTKGSRDLAKKSVLQNTLGLVYEWDDTREDDGGGDFLKNKKGLFFNEGRKKNKSLTEPRKHKAAGIRNVKSVQDHGEEENRNSNKRKLGKSVYSDPGLKLCKLSAKEKSLDFGKEVFTKNLAKDLDEQINLASERRLSDDDIPDLQNIGPDTQLAAEVMESFCFEIHLADNNRPNKGDTTQAGKRIRSHNTAAHLKQSSTEMIKCPESVGVVTRRAKRLKITGVKISKDPSLSSIEQSKNTVNQIDKEESDKRMRSDSNNVVLAYEKECPSAARSKLDEQRKWRSGTSEKKSCLQDQLNFSVPVAHRTRRCTKLNHSKGAENAVDATEKKNDLINVSDLRKKRTAVKNGNAQLITIEQLRKLRSFGKQLCVKDDGISASNVDELKHLQGKRTRQEKLLVGEEAGRHSNTRLKKSRTIAAIISSNPDRDHENRRSTFNSPSSSSLEQKTLLHQTGDNKRSMDDENKACMPIKYDEKIEGNTLKSAQAINGRCKLEASPGEKCGKISSTCNTPATCATPVNNPSPVCMGEEFHKQFCRKNLSKWSLMKELDSLVTGSPIGGTKERKKRDITKIKVLFSQHLDVDVIKQQNKILARLGAAVASSMSDATHFIADEFVRTRNMLEAIAFGKPVVTNLWLESCGQANCLIDEKNYILRDARKEKEFGFSMPISLSRACQYPLLQGQKVFVTPNTKPGKDILADLVKAVHGLVVERLGRSVLKDKKLLDDLLILSCKEDYDICVPFLEKGGAVYSSELLLNGIVKQKLEYERHRLFADHVRRTRSTTWLKKNQFLPVTKCK